MRDTKYGAITRRVRTGHLSVAVRDSGPAGGPVALLLHGWPDDATTWDRIAPRLAAASFRTIARMNRGTGRPAKPEPAPRFP